MGIYYKSLLAVGILTWVSGTTLGATVDSVGMGNAAIEAALRGQIQQEQLQEAQRTAIERGKRLDGAEQETSGITIDVPTANQTNTNTNTSTNTTVTTGEGSSAVPVFQVDRIVVDGAAHAPWLQAIADAKAGHPMGMTDIDTLVGAMNEVLVLWPVTCRATWTSSFHGQWTTGGVYLYGTDQISIGNRYTVRGFNGEYTLSSESGWYYRYR